MKPENILEITKVFDQIKTNGVPKVSGWTQVSVENYVMDLKYGQRYIMPVPENYITLFAQYTNVNSIDVTHIFDDMFEDIISKNPDLRRFQSVASADKYDVVMGAASWLLPRDIEYYITVPYNRRPNWIEAISDIANRAYGNKTKVNKYGFIEWVAFVYSAETAIAIIEDNTENLTDADIELLGRVAQEHPRVIPFKLHALINN